MWSFLRFSPNLVGRKFRNWRVAPALESLTVSRRYVHTADSCYPAFKSPVVDKQRQTELSLKLDEISHKLKAVTAEKNHLSESYDSTRKMLSSLTAQEEEVKHAAIVLDRFTSGILKAVHKALAEGKGNCLYYPEYRDDLECMPLLSDTLKRYDIRIALKSEQKYRYLFEYVSITYPNVYKSVLPFINSDNTRHELWLKKLDANIKALYDSVHKKIDDEVESVSSVLIRPIVTGQQSSGFIEFEPCGAARAQLRYKAKKVGVDLQFRDGLTTAKLITPDEARVMRPA